MSVLQTLPLALKTIWHFTLLLDNLSREKRSGVMASIKGKNTKPEIVVRRLLWSKGFRYRIHDKTIIGKPDVSNKKKKIAIFVDGCFWHGCSKCYIEPTTNVDFWRKKIRGNKNRRVKVKKELERKGWNVLELRKHDINQNSGSLVKKIDRFFENA